MKRRTLLLSVIFLLLIPVINISYAQSFDLIVRDTQIVDKAFIWGRADSIICRVAPVLTPKRYKLLYKQLIECYKPLRFEKNIVRSEYLDSIENVRRRDNLELIDNIYRAISVSSNPNTHIKAGYDYFRLHSRSKSIERYEEDSIITKLSLATLYRGYSSTCDIGIKINAINNIAEILYFNSSINDSKELYNCAILLNNENDAKKCASLYGYIRCHYSGTNEIDYKTAVKILPYYKDFAEIYSNINVGNPYGLYNLYAELGYISYVAKNSDFIKYCNIAVQVAKDAHIEWEILIDSILTHIGYNKNPNVILGSYYRTLGDNSRAVDCYINAGIVDESSFVEVHPNDIYRHIEDNPSLPIYKGVVSYPKNILALADIYYSLNQQQSSLYMTDALYYIIKNLLFVFHNYDSEDRREYVDLYSPLLSTLYSHPDPAWVYNVALFTKGITNNVDISLREAYNHNGYVDPQYTNFLKLKEAYFQNPNATTEHLMRKCEIDLLRGSFLIQGYLRQLEYTYLDVYNDIYKTSNVAIEFIKTATFGNEQPKYIALILRSLINKPIQIEICSVCELEKLYQNIQYRNSLYNSRESSLLYNLIWSKLEPYINEGDDVYFAPDGLLYQMNIEALQDANGRRANEKWNLHRVSSTRELCMEKPTVDINSAVLYGGLKYTMDDDELLAASCTYSREDMQSATRGFVADSTMRKGWNYLPETKTEVESIAQMCESHDVRAVIFSETAGNEESFKALSGKKTPIIHLATHGFFYKNEEVTKEPFFNVFNFDKMPQKPDNSLKRSGLILAGGQKAWLGEAIPDSVEDGILLAEEIALMDLTGTDLVVLSACETGLGEITSEGVFGLQRAFKKAGVQTIIMSLWSVNDLATSLFMRVFYHEWLSGKTKHEAFAIAQNTVRESYEGNDWAAFIMLD